MCFWIFIAYYSSATSELSPLERRGILIRSSSIVFTFGINASQFGASSGSPSTGRASCSCGTCPLIRQASPTADIDRSYLVSMSHPSTISTHIGAILRGVSCPTGRTFFGCIGRIDLLDLDAQSLSLVGDEGGELVEAPGILHAVVFAGER